MEEARIKRIITPITYGRYAGGGGGAEKQVALARSRHSAHPSSSESPRMIIIKVDMPSL